MAKSFGCDKGVSLRKRQEEARRLVEGIRGADGYGVLDQIDRRFVEELDDAFHGWRAPVVGTRTMFWLREILIRVPAIPLQIEWSGDDNPAVVEKMSSASAAEVSYAS